MIRKSLLDERALINKHWLGRNASVLRMLVLLIMLGRLIVNLKST